jgi:hypothetical protein
LSAEKFLASKYVVFDNDHLTLTRSGKLMADGIAAELFSANIEKLHA